MTDPHSSRSDLPRRRKPTHVFYVEIPIHVDEGETLSFDPAEDAIKMVLKVSRAAFQGFICDDPMVTVREGGEHHAD